MPEDDSLYTAMIWALSIGIIIVIVTLILTRPAPESFTELYFNNHTILPEYVSQGTKYNYSFTMHNLENNATNYNYTISTELYQLDYSCENPDLYLETQGNDTIPTRYTETNDQALFIKEKDYNISFNYDIKTGLKIISYKLVGIDGNDKYEIRIDHQKNLAYFIADKKIIVMNITSTTDSHKLSLQVSNLTTTLQIDDDIFYLSTPNDYTIGFPRFETTNTYAEIYNFVIDRKSAKESVNLRIADSKYQEYSLIKNSNPTILIQNTKFLADYTPEELVYNKLYYQPVVVAKHISQSATYYTNNSINLSSYTVRAYFRMNSNSQLKLGLDNIKIIYDRATNNITIGNQVFNVTTTSYDDLIIKIIDNKATIMLNNEELLNMTGNYKDAMPVLETINYVNILEFSAKANEEPITVNFKLPDKVQQSYAGLYTLDTIKTISKPIGYKINNTINTTNNASATQDINANLTKGLTEDDKQRLTDFFDRQKLPWTDYRISASYLDRNKDQNFTLSFRDIEKTLYTITIDSKEKTITTNYMQNNILSTETSNITLSVITRLSIDATNNTLSISINDQNVFNKNLDKTTDGIIIFDYGNITLLNAQVEDKNSNSIKIYKRQTNVDCRPLLVDRYIYNNQTTISDKASATINGYVIFDQPFDIAKVQIDIGNNQEIHYWVRNIQ